jgi:acyl-ACP thioesterase
MADMTAPNIWQASYEVRSYEVDAEGRLSSLALFNLLQDAASNHAQALGVSVQQLQAENRTWVLSRMRLSATGYPHWHDRLQVRTWPSGGNRVFAFRHFSVENDRGRPLAAAVSAWLVIDTESRRPQRIDPFIQRLRPVSDVPGLCDPLDKLPALAAAAGQKRFNVRYRDLDINRHVNNVSYIEWAVESLPRDRVAGHVAVDLEISFLGEAFLDDMIVARWHPVDGDRPIFLHSLLQEDGGHELARLRTTWEFPHPGTPASP